MTRTVVPLVLGTCIGAIAMWLLMNSDLRPAGSTADTPSQISIVIGLGQRNASDDSQHPSVAESLKVYRAAATASRGSLETTMARLAGAPSSAQRDLEISAVLTQIADFDPALAADLVLALNLDSHFVVSSFQYWSEVDGEAALAGLGRIGDSATQVDVALGLLDVVGEHEEAADRIATVLPNPEAIDFRVAWIARRVAADATGAMLDVKAIDDAGQRTRAIDAVASALVRRDPQGAIAQLSVLSGDVRRQFESAISSEWARLDPTGFLAYLTNSTLDFDAISNGFRWIVAGDPIEAFDFAKTIPGSVGRSLQQMALSDMAAIDPESALARIDEIPAGQNKETILARVAIRFAQNHPEAALEWARQLNPASDAITNSVIQTVIQSDIRRAVELLTDAPPGADPGLIAQLVGSLGAGGSGQTQAVADGLLRQSAPAARGALPYLLSGWLRNDADTALNWVIANAADLDRDIHLQVAQSLASADPRSAAAVVDRLPLDIQSDWIAQIARYYAASDHNGAVAWIARYEGSPGYDPAYRQIVLEVAQNGDALSAANLLKRASTDVQTGAAGRVGRQLAEQDPRAAARWAAELPNPPARVNAIDGVVSTWARTDFDAARRFTLALREDAPRDRALLALVTLLASQGEYDPNLLNEFSTDRERQQSIGILIPMLASHDPDRAWDLLDREITNASQRLQIEERLAERGIGR